MVINLKFPWAPLVADLSLFANDVVPNNYGGETEAQFYQHPIGTGPFKWDYWHKGSALKLVKNPNYWQPGLPYLNSVTFTDVPSDNTRELQLKGGQAQIDEFPAWSTVASLKSTPGVTMNLFNSTQTNYLAFNENVKPFQDVHVRRAISLAINRNALVKAVLFGNGKPANSLFPPQVPFYDATRRGPAAQHGAGQGGDGQVQRPARLHHDDPDPVRELRLPTISTIVQSELKPLGINVKIQTAGPEHGQHQPAVPEVRHDADAVDDGHPRPGRAGHLRRGPEVGRQVVLHRPTTTPRSSRTTHTAEQTTTPAARQSLYNSVQTDSAADAFMAFLYYSPYPYATSTKVHGFFVTPLGNYHLENVWLSK